MLCYTNMKSTMTQKMQVLREVVGQTQAEFSATIGASKDTVASWETGRNELSAALARRTAKRLEMGHWLTAANSLRLRPRK